MSFVPSSSRARLCRVCILLLFSVIISHGVWAFTLSGMNGVFGAIHRPQTWEPRKLILSVQEQIAAVEEEIVEEVLPEEDDFSDAFGVLFEEDPQPQLPSELWVKVAGYMPYVALHNAVQSRVLGVAEALCALAELAKRADEAGRVDLLTSYLDEALGLIYRRSELVPIGEFDVDTFARFAGDVYGVHLVGDNAIPESIGADLYRMWALVLSHAVKSESSEVRSRAYCELGFVLRLNVFAGQGVWLDRVYQCLFEGFGSLGYPEFLSLFVAFEHSLMTGVYSEEVQTLAFGCLIAMAFQPEAQSLVGEIQRVLVGQYERGLLSPDNAVIVDTLFLHPEKLFRFSLM